MNKIQELKQTNPLEKFFEFRVSWGTFYYTGIGEGKLLVGLLARVPSYAVNNFLSSRGESRQVINRLLDPLVGNIMFWTCDADTKDNLHPRNVAKVSSEEEMQRRFASQVGKQSIQIKENEREKIFTIVNHLLGIWKNISLYMLPKDIWEELFEPNQQKLTYDLSELAQGRSSNFILFRRKPIK